MTMATTLQAAVQPHLPLEAPLTSSLLYIVLVQIRTGILREKCNKLLLKCSQN